ncbi:MAG: hypothetical protein M1828_000745 [Chrysothrix sp. TS-e1954]|nr:MAG: hypothetical protein M1828_000745 [Chrysothrix sp. TS-e1954]
MDGLSRPRSKLVQRQDCLGTLARLWRKSYASDYIAIACILVAFMLIETFVEPFHRMFSLDNIAIQYPHAEVERVPPGMLFLYATAVPLISLILWALILRPGAHKAHVTFLGLFLSVFLTALLTDIVKNTVGRPRPDLLARCKPASGTPEHSLVSYDVCTETRHHRLQDGWRSFPSGHSSFSFSGLGYLALVIASQAHVLRPSAPLPLVCLPLIPLIGALLIAVSRTEDYRHDVWDVTTGSLLGLLVAWMSYRRYYPPLTSRYCEEPHALDWPKINGSMKFKDVEMSPAHEDAEGSGSDSEDTRLQIGQ